MSGTAVIALAAGFFAGIGTFALLHHRSRPGRKVWPALCRRHVCGTIEQNARLAGDTT